MKKIDKKIESILDYDFKDKSLLKQSLIHKSFNNLDNNEKLEFLDSYGLKKTGLDRLTKASFNLLGMETFFTAGEKEIKSWPIRKNTLAVDAAGEIHSDIQRGFIKAEIYSLDDLIQYQSEDSLKSNGKIRQEGKSYIVQDADIIFFKFNV